MPPGLSQVLRQNSPIELSKVEIVADGHRPAIPAVTESPGHPFFGTVGEGNYRQGSIRDGPNGLANVETMLHTCHSWFRPAPGSAGEMSSGYDLVLFWDLSE